MVSNEFNNFLIDRCIKGKFDCNIFFLMCFKLLNLFFNRKVEYV